MTLNRDFWIATFVLGFLAGISNLSVFVFDSFLFYILNFALFLWIICYWRLLTESKLVGLFAVILCCAFLSGGGRFVVDLLLDDGATNNAGNSSMMSGHWQGLVKVVSLSEVKGQIQDVILVGGLYGEGTPARRFLASFPAQEKIVYGERLLVSGEWAKPEKMNDNQKIVLFRKHLSAYLKMVKIDKRMGNSGIDLFGIIYDLRRIFLDSIRQTSAEPAASLISGVLIGERSNLPERVANDFQVTGLTHVLAISGFNITLIINLVISLSIGLVKFKRFSICLAVVIFFVVLTGASASVVRAGVMGVLILLVRTMGRRIKPFKIILISAFLIIMVDPRLLNFDLSFQLSIVATLSLVWFADRFEFNFTQKWKSLLWEGMSVTLAAQVITLPLIFYSFGRISLISPVANLLIGPMIPLLMVFGVGQLILALIWSVLAIPLAGLTMLLVGLMLSIVSWLAVFPLAQIEIGKGQIWLAIAYYALIFMVFHRRKSVPD